MITKYRATAGFAGRIKKVVVLRETSISIWTEHNRRESKCSSYYNYFDSFEEAKAFLVEQAEINIQSARNNLQSAQGRLGNVKGLKE